MQAFGAIVKRLSHTVAIRRTQTGLDGTRVESISRRTLSTVVTFCRHPFCPERVESGYCDTHRPQRKSSHQRGYTYRWSVFRTWWLQEHPLCVACEQNGGVTAATDVDHIIPHRGNQELFWSLDNLQSLCHSCHSKKTASGK